MIEKTINNLDLSATLKINEISKKLNININDRPQNLSPLKYFEICEEYENLGF